MSVSYSVISIGTLSRNRFWEEKHPVRAAHATTTLLRDGATILVDPGLPPEVLAHRLYERSGLKPEQIDIVFMTNFRPVHRRALGIFNSATWLMNPPEIEAMRDKLTEIQDRGDGSTDVLRLVREELELLERVKPAPDKLTAQVHLFPTQGVTPGAAGLLLAMPARTVLVAGDAVISQEYYEAGQVFEQCADLPQARESLGEIVEVADEIIPGHDNVFRVTGR